MAKLNSIVFLVIFSMGVLCEAALPLWSNANSTLNARVLGIDDESQLVILSKGASDNFRIGTYCDMYVSKEEVATLLVVACTMEKSLAMKMGDFQVKANDVFRLKLINNKKI